MASSKNTPGLPAGDARAGLQRSRTVAASGRARLIAAVTIALTCRTALAFFPTNVRTAGTLEGHSHERITTDALEALDTEFFGVQSPNGSMRAANEAIVDGNIHVDDDQLHSALHFDGENFVSGQARILGLKEAVIASMQENDAQGARQELGQALHSVQDFYAHSNWTNNNGAVNQDLGVDGHQLQNTLAINDPAEVNGVLTTGLTSGYYHGEDRVPPMLSVGHKDRHGGPFDSLSILDFGFGLNRDSSDLAFSPQFGQHEAAASLAGEATKKYVREIAAQITRAQLGLLLGKGPTLGLVIDTTNSMGPIIAAVRSAATQLVDDRLGTAEEPSQYVLGQINDPVTPAPVVTSSPDDFKTAIAALTTSPPGVDCPELAMAGMLAALGPIDSGGQLFVWTDASAKDSALSSSVSALAQSKNVRVNFVLFGSCSPIDPGYIQIANETGGQVFFLTPQEVAQASNLPVLLVGTKAVTVLSVRDSVVSGSKTYDVPVDSTMTDVTFSADTSSMEVRRPTDDPVQASDADATTLELSGGKVVKIHGPAAGTWKAVIGVAPAYRLEVSASSDVDLNRFRFVQSSGRDGHDGLFPIPGLPVGAVTGNVDAVLAGSVETVQFDLRRPDGEHIQDLSLAALATDAEEFAGSLTVPSEPFLPYVTGQDAGGHAFQRVVPKLIQPQSVSIVTPAREDLHAGAPTTYAFTVMNLGDAGTFNLTATDDKGFIVSADPSQAVIPSGGSATLTVVLQPPANAPPGTSDALTVRAESANTPGLGNFASLTSVVLQPEAASTTSSTSTTSTTTLLPTTTTVTSATTIPSTSTTTIPCTSPRCVLDAGLHGPGCAGQIVPPPLMKKLDRATSLIDGASGASPKKRRHVLHKARHLLQLAAKLAVKAAKGKKPKLTQACVAAIRSAVGTVAGSLEP
jgi:hypothetical protein